MGNTYAASGGQCNKIPTAQGRVEENAGGWESMTTLKKGGLFFVILHVDTAVGVAIISFHSSASPGKTARGSSPETHNQKIQERCEQSAQMGHMGYSASGITHASHERDDAVDNYQILDLHGNDEVEIHNCIRPEHGIGQQNTVDGTGSPDHDLQSANGLSRR